MKDLLQNGTFITIIGLMAGAMSASSMLPQLIKSFKAKKAEDVSPVMLMILIAGVGLWLFYGILRNDLPIMVTNAFSLLLNTCMLYLRWRYRKQ
ncbi:MAG: SemiSWEET transporter [Ginsengibacter sp.]